MNQRTPEGESEVSQIILYQVKLTEILFFPSSVVVVLFCEEIT